MTLVQLFLYVPNKGSLKEPKLKWFILGSMVKDSEMIVYAQQRTVDVQENH